MLKQVVSGGQTGVDRAALDVAERCNLDRGGWCPRGRRAEDGVIADSYPLQETPSRAYDVRTRWNVRDSDGTLVLFSGTLSGGTKLTTKFAEQEGKPLCRVDLADNSDNEQQLVEHVRGWLERLAIEVLNIAGPRESSSAGIYESAHRFLCQLFDVSQS